MSPIRGRGLPAGRDLLRALAVWAVSALLLACAAAVLVNAFGLRETQLGYVDSLISFLAALFAGAAAVRKKSGDRLLTVLVAATALVVFLLTLGFLINSDRLNPSSVLSVVSFSLSGCFAGGLLRKKRPSMDRRRPVKRKLT